MVTVLAAAASGWSWLVARLVVVLLALFLSAAALVAVAEPAGAQAPAVLAGAYLADPSPPADQLPSPPDFGGEQDDVDPNAGEVGLLWLVGVALSFICFVGLLVATTIVVIAMAAARRRGSNDSSWGGSADSSSGGSADSSSGGSSSDSSSSSC